MFQEALLGDDELASRLKHFRAGMSFRVSGFRF